MTKQNLTVIAPIRATKERPEIINQIDNFFLDKHIPKEINFIIVDDGSSEPYAQQISQKCKALNITYVYINSNAHDFSLARARNLGARKAQTPYIMFQDLDLMPYNGFYASVLLEIEAQNLSKNIHSFLMFSVIYLTKEATKKYMSNRKQFYIDKMLLSDQKYVEKFSPGTSAILLRKEHFHNIGEYDEVFSNWGHEDIDLNCRLILHDNLFKLPDHFTLDERNFNNIYEYKGWKSIYRLYGDRTFFKGIVLFHAWHETNQSAKYYKDKIRNKKHFHKKLKIYYQQYKKKNKFILKDKSILLDRYKYSLSPDNRLKCRSILNLIYEKLKDILN